MSNAVFGVACFTTPAFQRRRFMRRSAIRSRWRNIEGFVPSKNTTPNEKLGNHMRYKHAASGTITSVFAVVALIGCGSGDIGSEKSVETQAAPLATLSAPPTSVANPLAKQAIDEWHKTMSKKPLPAKGCFRASYPSMRWEEIPCVSRPPVSHLRPWVARIKTSGATVVPEAVGNGTGDSVMSASISSVAGSFPSVTGVTTGSEYGSSGRPDEFSLQINSNRFPCTSSTTCGNNANCACWQQFLFDNPSPLGDIAPASYFYIQYWLIGYGASCPSSAWNHRPENGGSCFRNSFMGTFDSKTITSLTNLHLTGTAVAGGNDTITIFDSATGELLASSASDNVLGLGQAWNFAEFNVFGLDGDAPLATFNGASTMRVHMGITNGTTASPTCAMGGETFEQNNLNLVPASCCATGGVSPAIEFLQTNATGVTAPFCLVNDIVPMQLPLQ